MRRIFIYDIALRDGSQGAGISFTVEDKIKIVKALDSFAFLMLKAVILEQIQKTICFFEQMKKVELKNAKLTAFGSTRRKGISIEKDKVLKAILKSGVK